MPGSWPMRTRGPSRTRIVACAVCGISFQTKHSRGKYCSAQCAREGARESWREYGARNRTRRREYHGAFYLRNRTAIAKRVAAYRSTESGRKAQQVNDQRQRAKSPEKIAARQKVKIAVVSGQLKRQPCVRCGAPRAQAHHPEYSRPLDVVWLCSTCHRTEHGSVRAVERVKVGAAR